MDQCENRPARVRVKLVVDASEVETERLQLLMQLEQRMPKNEAQLVFDDLVVRQ